jgi:hypothetical protein
MAMTLRNTDILFNDGTAQSTAGVGFRNSRVFTANGTFTPVTTGLHRVTVVGRGGLGGGIYLGTGSVQITGGGAGGLAQSVITLSAGTTYTATVAPGGFFFISAANDITTFQRARDILAQFGATSFSGSGITTITANAGEHGNLTTSTSGTTLGGLGGTASGGQINITGGSAGSITITTGGGRGCTGGGAVGWRGVGYSSGNITLSATTHYVSTGGAGIGGGSADATGAGTGSYVSGSNRFNVSGGGGSGAAGTALGSGAVGGAAITNLSDFYPTMPFLLNGVGGPGSTSSSTAATVPTSGAISPISTGGAGGGGIVVQGARSPGTGQGGALGGHGGMVIIATGSSQFAISSIGGGGAGLINAQTDGSRSCELSSGTNAGAMIIIEWN